MRVYSGHGRRRKRKKRTDMMSAGVYEKDEDGDTRPPGYYAISITY
jgi:hypothetical protein